MQLPRPSPKWMAPLAILGLGAAGVLLLFWSRETPPSRPPQEIATPVRVVTAAPGPYRFRVRTQGTVVPRTESALVPQVSGAVIWVSPAFVSGGFFRAGEPLVRLDPADARAAVEAAKAALARAESEERRTAREFERQRRLGARDIASRKRIDDAESAHEAAQAGLREARVRLGNALRELERTELRAPYTGRVRSESVDVGQFVTRGSPIAHLYAVDFAEVRLPVPDRELRFLDLPLTRLPAPRLPAAPASGEATAPAEAGHAAGGDEAAPPAGPAVHLSAEFAGTEHRWDGTIVRSEGEIDPRSRMVTLVARVPDPYGPASEAPLAVGLFVTAEIEGREVPEAVTLPRAALRDDGAVLVVGPDDRLVFRPVSVLRLERDRAVVGSGLAGGERICVTPLPGAIEGMRVRILEGGAAAPRTPAPPEQP